MNEHDFRDNIRRGIERDAKTMGITFQEAADRLLSEVKTSQARSAFSRDLEAFNVLRRLVAEFVNQEP